MDKHQEHDVGIVEPPAVCAAAAARQKAINRSDACPPGAQDVPVQVDIDTAPGQAGFVADDVGIDAERESGIAHGVDRNQSLLRGNEDVDVGSWPQRRVGIDDIPDVGTLDDGVADALPLEKTVELPQGSLLGHVGNGFRNASLPKRCANRWVDGIHEAMMFEGMVPIGRHALTG